MTEVLTSDGLHLALDHLKGKWAKQGAAFQSEVVPEQGRVTQMFTFDDQPYEVTVFADKSLQVSELVGGQRHPVKIPRGLTFPKGFIRTEGYDR